MVALVGASLLDWTPHSSQINYCKVVEIARIKGKHMNMTQCFLLGAFSLLILPVA